MEEYLGHPREEKREEMVFFLIMNFEKKSQNIEEKVKIQCREKT